MWNNCRRSIGRRKIKLEYEKETLDYAIVRHRKYTPDLLITKANGEKIYVEIKGYFRSEDVQKMMFVRMSNPDLDIRMIFPQDNKMVGRKKMRYSDWCLKYGIPCHIGTSVPKDWLT